MRRARSEDEVYLMADGDRYRIHAAIDKLLDPKVDVHDRFESYRLAEKKQGLYAASR
jgi:hypothetical protein